MIKEKIKYITKIIKEEKKRRITKKWDTQELINVSEL